MNASIWSDMFYRRCRSWKRWSGRSSSTVEGGAKKRKGGSGSERRHWSLGLLPLKGGNKTYGWTSRMKRKLPMRLTRAARSRGTARAC
jgi:hypothetical protein